MNPSEVRKCIVNDSGQLNIDALCVYLSALDDDREEMKEAVSSLEQHLQFIQNGRQ